MRKYSRQSYPEPKTSVLPVRGWPRGLDTLANPNAINNNELAEAINVAYSQYGVLSKRKGISEVVDLGSAVQGFGVLNKRNTMTGALTRYFCAVANGVFYTIDPINKTKTAIGGHTFHTSNRVVMRQGGLPGASALYIFDGSSNLVKWDGTSFLDWTPITTPVAPTLTKHGAGTGSKTLSYIVTASNDVGETNGSTNTTIASMPNTLNTDTYIEVAWTAVPSAKAYNIYRGSPGNETYLTTVTETTFNDQGQSDDTQSFIIIVPAQNTTSGPVFTTGTVYHDAVLGIDKTNPTRMWFSAGGDKIDSFSPGDGGGYYDYHPETGEAINGIEVFSGLGQDAVYMHKDHKLGQFRFGTSGQPEVSDVNLSVGGSSDASIVLFENDMAFWTPYGLYTLRQEPNFVNVLRISELSARVHPTYVNSVTPSARSGICGIYDKANHVMLFSIPNGATQNNTSLAYDPVYLSFSEYRGIAATTFTKFTDDNNAEYSYGGTAAGKVFRLFDGTSDMGSSIYFRAATKVFDMDMPYSYKYFLKVFFFFGNVAAQNLKVTLIKDGIAELKQFTVSTDQGQTGWDADLWDDVLWDDSSGSPVSIISRSVLKYMDIFNDLFSLQTVYENNSTSDSFEILSQYFLWQQSDKPLDPTKRIS